MKQPTTPFLAKAVYYFVPSYGPSEKVTIGVYQFRNQKQDVEFRAAEEFQAKFRNDVVVEVNFDNSTVQIIGIAGIYLPPRQMFPGMSTRIKPGETATFVVNRDHVVMSIV